MEKKTKTAEVINSTDIKPEVNQPKQIDRKLKVLTMISGILTILIGISFIASSFLLMGVFASSNTDNTANLLWLLFGGFILFMVFFLILIALGITILCFGIAEIRLATKPNHEYMEKNGAIIAYVCFDIVAIIVSGLTMFMFKSELAFLIIAGVIAVASLMCLILKIIDYRVFHGRVKKGLIDVKRPKVEFLGLNLAGLQELNPAFKKPTETSEVHDDLKKVEQLKADGLITEEEYKHMRESILQRIVKKAD